MWTCTLWRTERTTSAYKHTADLNTAAIYRDHKSNWQRLTNSNKWEQLHEVHKHVYANINRYFASLADLSQFRSSVQLQQQARLQNTGRTPVQIHSKSNNPPELTPNVHIILFSVYFVASPSTFMQHNALGQHAHSATLTTSQCAYILKYVSPNIRMIIKSQICIGE